MPIYEYECAKCGIHFDRLQRFGDPLPDTCPNGHSQVHRLLSQPAIIFKGSGFYVTDNGRNGSGKTSASRPPKETKSTAETTSSATDKAEE
jgi:putative FmdB family regulatory protein